MKYIKVEVDASGSTLQNQLLNIIVKDESDNVEADIQTLLKNTLNELREQSDTKTYLKDLETTISGYDQTLAKLEKKIKRPYNFFDIIHW